MSKLKENIDRILGNSIRCLLPSYWWKRLFGMVVDEVEKASVSAKNANTKISNISSSLDSEKTSTVRISDNTLEANKKALEKITGEYYSNPVRVVYGNSVSIYCNHYWSNDEFFCYIIFDDKSNLINDNKQEKTYVIRLYEDGTIEKKTHFNQLITSVDGTLSQLSTNPIQNKVVSIALLNKADEADVEQEFKDRETIAIYVPAEGQTLPRLLRDQNGQTIAYKWNSIYGHKEQSWGSIRDDYDKVNKRGVVYVYHGVAYQGSSELDVQYILTQHTALTIEAIDDEIVDGWYEDRIYMRFYDSDNRLCIAKVGGKAEIEVVDTPVDTELSETSTNPVQNKVVKEYIDNAVQNVEIDVDASLSSTSTNPVQNRVVYDALQGKASTSSVTSLDNAKADKTDIKTLNGVSLLGGGNLQLGDGETIVYDDTAVWDRLEETEKTTKEYINNASVVFAENLVSSEDSARNELPALQDFYGRNSSHTYRFDSILGNTIVKDGVFHHSCPTRISSFNQELYDGLFERGAYDKTTGEKIESDTLYRFKNPIRVLPQTYYTLFSFDGEVFFFDKDGMLISWEKYGSKIFTPENVYYISATFRNASVGTNLHVVKGRTSTLINHPEYCRRDVDLSFIEKYFPNGMAGTKSVYDEVYFDSVKRKFYAVSRFIVKPAWELSWNVLEANTSHIGGFWTRQEDFYTNHARHNLIITMYDYKLKVSAEDDKVYNSESYVLTNSITIFDSEFSDVEAFTEHLRINKVYVCYETKNPIITEVDESPARCLLVPEDGSRLIEFKGDNDILIAMVAEGVDTYKEILKVSVLSDDVDDVYDGLDTIWEEIEYLVDDIKEIDDYYADVTQELYDKIYALEQRIAALEGNQTT